MFKDLFLIQTSSVAGKRNESVKKPQQMFNDINEQLWVWTATWWQPMRPFRNETTTESYCLSVTCSRGRQLNSLKTATCVIIVELTWNLGLCTNLPSVSFPFLFSAFWLSRPSIQAAWEKPSSDQWTESSLKRGVMWNCFLQASRQIR